MSRNLRLFVLFRALYNCRFYYPVYAILFLDFGLDLAEFALLNFVWAIAITLFEVPSGALADRFGRKPLVVVAAVLMVVEILVLCIAPVGGSVFWFFLANRLISGLSEACGSGADEALAYDSIPEGERESRWAAFLPRAMRWVAVGFLITPIIGAFVYDAGAVNRALLLLGIDREVLSTQTMRFPLYFNLVTALGALVVALLFQEKDSDDARGEKHQKAGGSFAAGLRASLGDTWRAGSWILQQPTVLGVILLTLLADSFIRLAYTIASNYYRLIGIADSSVGWISAMVTLVGIGTTFLLSPMANRFGRPVNFGIVSLLVFAGLFGLQIAPANWLGVIAFFPILLAIRFSIFFASHEINAATDSSQRATVLSFRSFGLNLGYGILNLVYGWVWLRQKPSSTTDSGPLGDHDFPAFERSLDWLPWTYALLLGVGFALFVLWQKGRRGAAK